MTEKRTLPIEFLYLDLTTCGRCVGTGGNLKRAVERLTPTLADVGVALDVRSVHVRNEDDARKYKLKISPTVRINGRDIQPNWDASECGECGELCCSGSTKVECRLWDWEGAKHTVAPVPLIMSAILAESFPGDGGARAAGREVPENLKTFFRDKAQPEPETTEEACCAAHSCCGTDCC